MSDDQKTPGSVVTQTNETDLTTSRESTGCEMIRAKLKAADLAQAQRTVQALINAGATFGGESEMDVVNLISNALASRGDEVETRLINPEPVATNAVLGTDQSLDQAAAVMAAAENKYSYYALSPVTEQKILEGPREDKNSLIPLNQLEVKSNPRERLIIRILHLESADPAFITAGSEDSKN